MPERTGESPQLAVNLTGTVVPILKVRTGLGKLPPVASAPAIGERKPVNCSAARVTLKVQLDALRAASRAAQVTSVVPIGNNEPEAGVQVTLGAGSQLSVAFTLKVTGTSKSTAHATDKAPGDAICGPVVSCTTTLWVWTATFPCPSSYCQVTV